MMMMMEIYGNIAERKKLNVTKLKPIYKNPKIYWILFVKMHIILIKIQEKFIHNF